MKQQPTRKIDWNAFRIKCPKCKSVNLERLNKYKMSYEKGRLKWKLREVRLYKCKVCGNEFWK